MVSQGAACQEIKQRSSKRGKQPPPAITNEHANPCVIGDSRPADTTHQAPDRLCKQEVAGSIPAGSTGGNACKEVRFGDGLALA
jgi:hypothetical protein